MLCKCLTSGFSINICDIIIVDSINGSPATRKLLRFLLRKFCFVSAWHAIMICFVSAWHTIMICFVSAWHTIMICFVSAWHTIMICSDILSLILPNEPVIFNCSHLALHRFVHVFVFAFTVVRRCYIPDVRNTSLKEQLRVPHTSLHCSVYPGI